MTEQELPLAKELTKQKKVSKDFYNKIVKKIIRFKETGRVTQMCGQYSCKISERDLAIELLEKRGYAVSMSYNSHGAPYLVITW